MVAATWIQSIKAVLLLFGGYVLAILTLAHFNFSINELFTAVANAKDLGPTWLEPGGWLKNPLERYSLGFSLLFGTAAMPTSVEIQHPTSMQYWNHESHLKLHR